MRLRRGGHDKVQLESEQCVPVNINVATKVPNDRILVRIWMLFGCCLEFMSITHRDIMYIIFTITNGRFLNIVYSSPSDARMSQRKA